MMRSLFSNLAFICVLAALTACGVSNAYKEVAEGALAANLKPYEYEPGMFTWVRAYPKRFDNQALRQSVKIPLIDAADYRVAPGNHTVTVDVTFNQGHGGGQYNAIVDVQGNFEAGKTYWPHSEVDGAQLSVWLETEKGERAGETVKTAYKSVTPTQITPIFIPQK